jgi:hypothetical protein
MSVVEQLSLTPGQAFDRAWKKRLPKLNLTAPKIISEAKDATG